MYVVDNLGNRYDHIEVGGTAGESRGMSDGDTLTGWFEFPPPDPDALYFTFYDDDQGAQLGRIVLFGTATQYDRLNLIGSNFSILYPLVLWERVEREGQLSLLSSLRIPNCTLSESPDFLVEGKYTTTIVLATIEYEIYKTLETDWSVREYLAVAGFEELGSVNPLFIATIPYDDSLQCIFDLSSLLSTLEVALP